jgi:hypothetical protein
MVIFREWIFKPILFVLLLPFLLAWVLMGFIMCWQCQKHLHFFQSKKYDLITNGSERVCKDCYTMLEESKQRWKRDKGGLWYGSHKTSSRNFKEV